MVNVTIYIAYMDPMGLGLHILPFLDGTWALIRQSLCPAARWDERLSNLGQAGHGRSLILFRKKNAMWWLGDRRKRGRHLNMLMASFHLVPVHWYTMDGWVQCVRGKHPCFKHVDRDVRLLPPSSDFVLGMLFLYVSLLFWGYCQSAPVQRQKLIAPMITHDYIFSYQPFFPYVFLRKEHSRLLY